MKLIEAFLKWYRGGDEPYTVACDYDQFWRPFNEREQLYHKTGIKAARRFAQNWVIQHPRGQARILKGHLNWE